MFTATVHLGQFLDFKLKICKMLLIFQVITPVILTRVTGLMVKTIIPIIINIIIPIIECVINLVPLLLLPVILFFVWEVWKLLLLLFLWPAK